MKISRFCHLGLYISDQMWNDLYILPPNSVQSRPLLAKLLDRCYYLQNILFSPFTEDDLAGIQKLGEGTKAMDPNKTGQYGVGFNCVYHLTDAPSFLTSGQKIGKDNVCNWLAIKWSYA